AHCTVAVHFNPTSTGAKAGFLTMTQLNPGQSITENIASLSGTGFAAVSPTSLAFGNQLLSAGPTATRTVTVSNLAGAPTLAITNIAFTGANGSQYSRPNTGANDCGTVYPKNLAAGTNCTIGVAFDPTT